MPVATANIGYYYFYCADLTRSVYTQSDYIIYIKRSVLLSFA